MVRSFCSEELATFWFVENDNRYPDTRRARAGTHGAGCAVGIMFTVPSKPDGAVSSNVWPGSPCVC